MSELPVPALQVTVPDASRPDFDRIARLYRWLEYATLGPLLEQTRNRFLIAVADSTQALILGDGDGRFTARLLAAGPRLHAEAVDLSASMLTLLARRAAGSRERLRTCHTDARTHTPASAPDLVVTHFFLDCLTQTEVDDLIVRLTPILSPGARWLVSEFRIPNGPLHWPTRLYIRALYLAFQVLTALRVRRLPDYATPLRRAGFTLLAERRCMLGLLTSELWQYAPQPRPHSSPASRPDPDNPHLSPALQLSMLPSASGSALVDLSAPAPGSAGDAQPDPEPAVPPLDDPDPGVFHHEPTANEETR